MFHNNLENENRIINEKTVFLVCFNALKQTDKKYIVIWKIKMTRKTRNDSAWNPLHLIPRKNIISRFTSCNNFKVAIWIHYCKTIAKCSWKWSFGPILPGKRSREREIRRKPLKIEFGKLENAKLPILMPFLGLNHQKNPPVDPQTHTRPLPKRNEIKYQINFPILISNLLCFRCYI